MAKRKSNRAARRLFGMPFWFSNLKQFRAWQVFGGPVWVDHKKLSLSQRRAAKVIQALRAEAQEKAL